MLFALIVIGAMLLAAGLTAFGYERVMKLAPLNFVGVPKTTPYEELIHQETNDPPEPLFDEDQFKRMFLNEDEEEVQQLVRSGKITESQVPDVLDALGISHEVFQD